MYFWLPRLLWWRQNVRNGQMRYEIIPSTHTLSKYEKKLAVLIHPNGLFKGMFLPIYAMYCKNRAYGRLSWTDAHSVINSDEEINLVSNCSEKYEEYSVKSFCGGIIFHSAVTNENVQKCVFCVIFYEMLIMAWNVCKKN